MKKATTLIFHSLQKNEKYYRLDGKTELEEPKYVVPADINFLCEEEIQRLFKDNNLVWDIKNNIDHKLHF